MVVHDERGLEVRIVLQADAPRDTVERVRLDLGAAIEATGAIAPPVSVHVVDRIERERVHAAKLKLVKAGPFRPNPL